MKRALLLVLAFILGFQPVRAQEAKRLLLLAQGPDGHPPATHEYLPGLSILQKLLAQTPGVKTTLVKADEPWRDGPDLLDQADGAVIFLSEGAKWLSQDPRRLAACERLAKRKGALVGLHWGIGTKDAKNIDAFVKLVGACHGGPDRKYKVVSETAHVADARHPIARGIKDFKARDEFYYFLKLPKLDKIQPILQVPIDGKSETVCWAFERPDGGRSFGFSGLHFHENWSLPEYRRLVTQGVLWALNVPIPEAGVDVSLVR